MSKDLRTFLDTKINNIEESILLLTIFMMVVNLCNIESC